MRLSLGFSPCPNDTFIFHALVHGVVPTPGLEMVPVIEDVETLNRLTGQGELDVSKVSYGALPYLLENYVLLRSGGALGRGCGPLLVTRAGMAGVRPSRIAIPGQRTTANLLLRMWDPQLPPGTERVYSEIMPGVARGEYDAGLIIHESRFTYPEHDLEQIVDLGEWWEQVSGHPIPLGGIVARRELGREVLTTLETAIRRSVEHAFAEPARSAAFVARHAQEMSDAVREKHIGLYVNDFSVDLGAEGEDAVHALLSLAARTGVAPTLPRTPLLE